MASIIISILTAIPKEMAIDKSVNRCTDFYQYACGTLDQEQPINIGIETIILTLVDKYYLSKCISKDDKHYSL